MEEDDTTEYCLCRQPYDGARFMIECDICKDWFHGDCVGILEHQASDIEIYHCPNCQVEHGPLVLKRRRNWHRHDYSEDDITITKAVQTGTVQFIRELKNRTFPSADEIPLVRAHGSELTEEYFEREGFLYPLLIKEKDGLDLKVPPPSFTIQDVENHVGSMREIDVIDVARQEDYKMLMREWTEYYNSPNRNKIFNVISLEFTKTKLADVIEPPKIVRELSWVQNYWPETFPDDVEEEVQFNRPNVQRYCLMGVKDSFTDFHIDFGGTSVWYHVLRGEKVFYFVRPTATNLQLYENWLSSSGQSETFFGDQTDACYKVVVKQGQTVFIPTGWIHAVFTPIDSLVFGGNFLHNYNIELQLACYEIEKRVNTPEKYMFPNYEPLHWYVSKHFLDILKEGVDENVKVQGHIVNGARAIACALKSWSHKRDYIKRENIPETIQYGKLLKDLNKVLKQLQVKSPGRDRAEKRPQKSSRSGEESDSKEAVPLLTPGSLVPDVSSLTPAIKASPMHDVSGLPSNLQAAQSIKFEDLSDDPRQLGKKPMGLFKKKSSGSLKVRIPKAGAYMDMSVYDFSDEPDDDFGSPTSSDSSMQSPFNSPKLGFAVKMDASGRPIGNKTPPGFRSPPSGSRSPRGFSLASSGGPSHQSPKAHALLPPKADPLASLKLKISNGKTAGEDGDGNFFASSIPGGLTSPSAPLNLEEHSDESEDSTDNLVVDENPLKKPANRIGPLKLKLPVRATDTDSSEFANPADRMNMPTIRGGLNGSIADILEASGYGTETDFKIDEDIGRASPSMRDAIQGMLSMSRGGVSPLGAERPKPSIRLQRQRSNKRKYIYDDDTGENMDTCFKDDEFVYPTLELTGAEDEHIFKPRGKVKKDETWNPKAKLQPNCPKPDRPARPGAKKESMESGLAAAAVALAHQPPAKRQYIKKKPKMPKPSILDSPQPGTSTGFVSGPLQIAQPAPSQPGMGSPPSGSKASTNAFNKAKKKGMLTTKQRLGKILKIHKMWH